MRYFTILVLVASLFSCTSKTEHARLTFLLKGNESFEEGNLEKANYYYNEAILTDSAYIDAYLNNALVLKAKGEYYGAIEMYDAVLAMNPMDEDVLYKRANLYLDVDQYYRALDDLKALDKTWNDSSVLFFTKGLVNSKLKRYDKAIADFKHSVTLNAAQSQAFVNIGNIFYYQGLLDSAKYYIKKGLDINPKETNGLNTLGLIATETKDYEKAIANFNEALQIDPKNGWFMNNKGFAFLQLDKFDSASYLINESMKLDPYNAWVYRNKGLLELKMQHAEKALKHLQKAYKMEKNITDIMADLAYVYILNGQYKEACDLVKSVDDEAEKAQLIKTYCL